MCSIPDVKTKNPQENQHLTRWQADYIANAYRELESGVTTQRIEALQLEIRGKAILDVGCGPGNFLVAVSSAKPKNIVGLEPDRQFLAVARTELERRSVANFTLMAGNATYLPFVDGSFDVVTCFLVLPHVTDDRRTLTELARVLKKGGTLAISGHDKGFPIRYLKRMRFKPLLMYLWSLVYNITGTKLIGNTLQNHRNVCTNLTEIGCSIDQITLSRGAFGLIETYRIKAIKG